MQGRKQPNVKKKETGNGMQEEKKGHVAFKKCFVEKFRSKFTIHEIEEYFDYIYKL